MENKLFTTVAIEDKHVGEFKIGFTSSGEMVFGKLYLDNTRLKWYCEDDNYEDKYGFYPYVTHVLEEIDLPIEYSNTKTDCDYNMGYKDGANYILNKLR